MSATVRYAPYDLRDAGWDEQRGRLADTILGLLDEYVPEVRPRILHQRLLTPLDWEREYGLTEGGTYHGQMDLDQLLFMRPVPGWGRYRTPVAGLYLCGSGTHPGGGVTGAPGFNAAREVLRD
jgi:phytoene dehydrogenase-like protein